LEKISLDLGKEKEQGMQLYVENIRTNFDINEELCTCFKDRQKTFDEVNWTKLTQILKGAGIDWHERLIRNFTWIRVLN
jgi:hypothetical protein